MNFSLTVSIYCMCLDIPFELFASLATSHDALLFYKSKEGIITRTAVVFDLNEMLPRCYPNSINRKQKSGMRNFSFHVDMFV
jgi:hypothetical protein